MSESAVSTTSHNRWRDIGVLMVPLLLVTAVIAIFLGTNGAGLQVDPVVPIETVQIDRPFLRPGEIEITIRNTSPEEIRIAQININDAIWDFQISKNPIPRLETATITMNYPWIEGDPYSITMITSSSILLTSQIDAAAITQTTGSATIGKLTLVGLYVGVIPVVLGMLWLPLVQRLTRSWTRFLMAATVGLLIFLGIDALGEANEQALTLAGPYQGVAIIGLGVVLTFALLEAIGMRQQLAQSKTGSRSLGFATMVAIGMGLHNLGEGMAIGASFAIGAASLGTFLVVGFIVQNVTEGLGIVIPLAKDKPASARLALLAVIAGAPAIVGAWIGGYSGSVALAVLFLSIGAGAVLQVAWSIGRELVWKPGEAPEQRMPMTSFAGLAVGMLTLFVMGVFIK